jgi:hypothetical protein
MSLLGDPDYKKLKLLTENDLMKMTDDDILYSYIIIKTDFEFNPDIKYPSIPCFLDSDLSVYPLKGNAILTGSEYILARNMGCHFTIGVIYHIPFKTVMVNDKKVLSYQPFKNCINELQSLRREYEKGSVNNSIYKFIGNSLYGLTTKGISNKTKKLHGINTRVRMKGNE